MSFFGVFTPAIEIIAISLMINYLLSFFWNTRSMDLFIGVFAFLILVTITSILRFPVLYSIMTNLVNIAALALVIIFQPELRVALSKLSLKGKSYREATTFDIFLEQLTSSLYRLSEERIGALIVLEHQDKLGEFIQKSIVLNAEFSPELIETIFYPLTPLHDGAVIIRNMTIVAAAVILPLSEESTQISRSMGTRHRAALGISQRTDAIVLVVSEESGKVTFVREGSMIQGIQAEKFKGIIRSIFTISAASDLTTKFNLRQWLNR